MMRTALSRAHFRDGSLNIPYEQHLPAHTRLLKQWSGNAFNFALYFQEPGIAEKEPEADTRRTLRLFFYSL
ncbi:hypothetical protein [Ktedonospora formicarum]|uniref:Uncharacterized protein n=1 Tax=Ktedonospora formicarum TaxID=2778364 RepID=A0A8J3MTC2_9CHLR|nr:hypothetical protein [Ktedonospora formicarum]GHO46990.1 hypothetical protein KSX_51530 [Ktedonospora formicarum]